MKIALKMLKELDFEYWRAYDLAEGRDHIGGTGCSPAEAIGCMIWNHSDCIDMEFPIEWIWFSAAPENYRNEE